jgi:signal transduction histidine kinase
VIAFGLLAALSTGGLGLALRESRVNEVTADFRREVKAACGHVADEVKRQAEGDRRLINSKTDFVDQTLLDIEGGRLDERRLALATRVPALREELGFDGMVLVTGGGEVLGAAPKSLLNLPPQEVKALIGASPEHFLRGTKGVNGFVARCRRDEGGRAVALIGVRERAPLLRRLTPAELEVTEGTERTAARDAEHATCSVQDQSGTNLTLTVTKSKASLYHTLANIDLTVLYASLASAGAALLLGILLARNLSRPLSDLAEEAGKVARGEAKPIPVRGSREVKDVAGAFNRMLRDLEGTRRRLAAASRIAAWREVARRVAHEVKNPLAPIRAAVETLRRLRAREDPAFDEYFDEATRTVLDEVHRIANIVTEFTKFARLPAPKPKPENVVDLAQRVVSLQRAAAGEVRIEVRPGAAIPTVTCDADQIVQVLTNLVQNAVEAVKGIKSPLVIVEIDLEGTDRVAVTVRDSGPGVPRELMARLFEPYATTKAQGTGLGLAIAQRIAVEHGGELAYVADGGTGTQGATFRLVLPVEGPDLGASGEGNGRSPESEVQSDAPP